MDQKKINDALLLIKKEIEYEYKLIEHYPGVDFIMNHPNEVWSMIKIEKKQIIKIMQAINKIEENG